MLKAYRKFILKVNTPQSWKVFRYILHILTIPVKLFTIGFISLLMHLFYLPFLKRRAVPKTPPDRVRKERFLYVYKNLPVFDNGTMQLYTNRVDYYSLPNGNNHNTDHQCSRHGTYSFILNKLEASNDKVNTALERHMWKHLLFRGYKEDGSYNLNNVSGDMLLGMCLALTNAYRPSNPKPGEENSYVKLKDSFDEVLFGMIENDYSLIENQRQDDDPIQSEVWDEQMKLNSYRPEKVKVKSARAMLQPGLETVGAQAITMLAAMRVGDKVVGSLYAKREYKKLFWLYGYGLLSLFPTTFIPSKRGYFNDHNCLVAAYVLSKLSTNKLEKFYWNLIATYIWSLSYPYYNGYFTGLLNEVFPGIISKKYTEDCISFLYEEDPAVFSGEGGVKIKPKEYPVKYNEQDRDEFHVDKDPMILTEFLQKSKSGLGFFSAATMLELDKVKKWLA